MSDCERDFLTTLPPLPLPSEMRLWDQTAIQAGLPEVMLMENAGREALAVLEAIYPNLDQAKVWLLMGGGNNGGDAACLARHLLDYGADVLVLHTKPLKSYKGAAAKHLQMAKIAGVEFCPLARKKITDAPALVIDGLLGTGFHGELQPAMRQLIEDINKLDSTTHLIFSLDLPSGLNAKNGQPSPLAVRAKATVTFAAAKTGLILPEAREWVGDLYIRPIGLPTQIIKQCPCSAYLLDQHCLQFWPTPKKQSYKNTYGHVLAIGGANGLSGAIHLAARATLRCCAGLVTVAAPASSLPDVKCGWPEIMTLALTEQQSEAWPKHLPTSLQELLRRCSSVILGPGLGREDFKIDFIAELLEISERPPIVLDADALHLLAKCPDLFSKIKAEDILTPHPGEAATLLGCKTVEVQADRVLALQKLCALQSGAVILKGAGSLVGQGTKPLLISPYDLPQLAIGGAGDVLSGCLAALLGLKPNLSAYAIAGLGVVKHALAGLVCAQTWPGRGNSASELADALAQTDSF